MSESYLFAHTNDSIIISVIISVIIIVSSCSPHAAAQFFFATVTESGVNLFDLKFSACGSFSRKLL